MKKNNIQVDTSKGYDVMKGAKVIAHYPGTDVGLALAQAFAAEARNRYVRYWGKKDLAAVGCAEVA